MKAKGTFCFEPNTLQRLQRLSERFKISQSTLVDRLVARGLDHLEENWKPVDEVIAEAFEVRISRKTRAALRKTISRENKVKAKH